MAWIELHQTLPKNKKTMKLKRLLKIKTPQAVGHLCMLWLWALDNAVEGDLSEFSADDIAEVCEWTKKPEDLMNALIDAGFVTDDRKLHDWDDYAGRLLARRDVKKEQSNIRQQRYRDKQKKIHNGVTQDNATVTHNECVSNAPIPYPTVPNPTVPYPTVPICGGGGDTREAEKAFADGLIRKYADRQATDYDIQLAMDLMRTVDIRTMEASYSQEHAERLEYAFQEAAKAGKGGDWKYIIGVLDKLDKRGIYTADQARRYDIERGGEK